MDLRPSTPPWLTSPQSAARRRRIGLVAALLKAALLGVLALVLLSGCAAPLPSLEGRSASMQFPLPLPAARVPGASAIGSAGAATSIPTSAPNSPFAAIRPPAGVPADHSGVVILSSPLEAYAARVLMIRAAVQSLDVQYYIWKTDTTGLLLLDELRAAAERGVRVRLLLDDNGIEGMDRVLAELDALPNLEVRLFNPFSGRSFKRLGYLSDFKRLNQRMHNKSLTVDALATLVGGRNIGDPYFGLDDEVNFADVDALALGPVAREVGAWFDQYWNSDFAYPIDRLLQHAGEAQAVEPSEPLAERVAHIKRELAAPYQDALNRSTTVQALLQQSRPLNWARVRVLSDPPSKFTGTAPERALMLDRLSTELGRAQSEVDLVSAYFVPGERGSAILAELARSGVQTRIITNSLAATDVASVHAGYARHRKALLAAGVKLYEFKPDASLQQRSGRAGLLNAARRDRALLAGRGSGAGSAASLHGKTFLVDRSRLFVGSFNLDQRSFFLNSEMGLIIDSPAVSRQVAEGLDRELAAEAYEVRLNPAGRLVWIERTPEGEQEHRTEPNASLWRRFLSWVLHWLPVEWML
ncbi:phospholipase D family protein [Piscinibacterium candidicorallinum]|uniref:Phospholipase D family protein n=1 Tax=Piscinibacterium candidicorallinum TaxID=1793872 RepID=A0ABV7H6C9_9BURK